CCEDCQQWVPGVMFGPRKRKFKFYCAECRARRRELGRKMNYYKRFGCGECAGCTVATDCGVCRGCLFRSSEPAKTWKCVKRRCHKLRDIKAETTCRNTTVKPKRDIKAETTCRNTTVQPKKKVKSQFEGLKKAMKKVKRETQTVVKKPPRKIKPEPPVVEEAVLEEVKQEEEEQEEVVELHKIECPKQEPSSPMPEETAQETPLQLFTAVPVLDSEDLLCYYNINSEFLVKTSRNRRNTRSCGECEACLRPVDCGSCDFCKDKAKFGGFNTLRQKCRWKQCLQFASKRLLPREAQQSGPDRKETGYRTGHRRWRENAFATRKVARVIQAAKKRKIWQAFPSAPEARVTDAGQEMQEERGPHKHTSSLGDVR
ncbi:methyl-CpG-binding domain protein 1-like, partial [Stegostoma tigrinum]|uniref:methyl-CpG-binding domain protein 1-like n=1 Tax=Stegostoma tigrinum TaxID=3053191 RepID=UPI00286FBC6E